MPPGRGSRTASVPIQRTSMAGSTRKSNTVGGEARILISRETTTSLVPGSPVATTPPLLGLGLELQRVEPLVPELLEEGAKRVEALEAGAVDALGALPARG